MAICCIAKGQKKEEEEDVEVASFPVGEVLKIADWLTMLHLILLQISKVASPKDI